MNRFETLRHSLMGRPRWVFHLSFALVVMCWTLLVFYYEPPHVIFGDEPISGRDLDTHVGQAWRVSEALDGFGKSWAYDPQMLAGYPNGTIFDADNKGWEVWTFAFWKAGLSRGLAFNLFIFFTHLLCPIVLFAAARMFGLKRGGALFSMTLGVLIWFFDGFIHWAWWEGMVAYSFVAYFCLLPLALLHRFMEDGKWWRVILLAPIMAAAHLVHPYVFFILTVPMSAIYLRGFKSLGWKRHMALAAVVATTLAVNAYWLLVAMGFWHYILDSGYLGASTLGHLFTDYFGLVSDRSVTGGAGMRSGFRFLSLAMAIVTLVYWRKEKDRRFLLFAVGMGLLAVATYLGGYFTFTQQVQPYRFVAPLIFLSVIPAGHLFERLVETRALFGLPRAAYLLLFIVVIAAMPRLIRDALYFIPDGVPEAAELEDEKPRVTDMIGFGSIGFPKHKEFGHEPIDPDMLLVSNWLERNNKKPRGRVAVENWTLGELIAWRTDMEMLGGFRLRNLEHSAANFFRRYPVGDPPPGKMRRFIEGYAVKYVVASVTFKRFYDSPRILKRVIQLGHHVIFESKIPPNFFQKGSGEVEASMNLISVRNTDPNEEIVLRYHWLETLACTPKKDGACTIKREKIPDDPVGFIKIPKGHPKDFDIVNTYELVK